MFFKNQLKGKTMILNTIPDVDIIKCYIGGDGKFLKAAREAV